MVFGIAGQFNGIMIISEMRVPPQNLGSAIVILMTVGTMTAAVSPMLAQISDTFNIIYPSALALSTLILSCFLIEPGTFLPKSVKLSENVTLLKTDALNQIINDSVQNNVSGFSLSFSRTYIEKIRGVERPRLNETSMDPDFYMAGDDDDDEKSSSYVRKGRHNDVSHDRSYSRVIKKWDWELGATFQENFDVNERDLSRIVDRYIEPSHLTPIMEQ